VKRLVALTICISLLGITAAPACYLPCCCKFKAPGLSPASAKSCCHSHGKDQRISRDELEAVLMGMEYVATVGAASTCLSQQHSCCAKKSVRRECPNCRCLEHMQLIALAGSTSSDVSERLSQSTVCEPAESSFHTSSAKSIISPLLDDHQSIVITLQTCTLRC
jgi:hypothetical protein